MEAEIEVILAVQEYQELLATLEAGMVSPSESPGGTNPADTLIPDFGPLNYFKFY